MARIFLSFLLSLVSLAQTASAQDIAWVQVEALPSLNVATERARAYERQVRDVNGFALGGGWYGIILGPYTQADAETALQVYRDDGLVPRDAFISYTDTLGQQFWPIGANTLSQLQDLAADDENSQPIAQTPVTPQVQPDPEPVFVDETPRQARASEAKLNRDQRKHLQMMLKWAGYYNSAIDGAFGRGTRGSMSNWQADNGFEPTGILTTHQRAALSDQYNAVLRGLGLKVVTASHAGIEMQIPTGVVAFEKNESPFAHFAASGDMPARVLLISQAGDQSMLYGLYDIMQTLEIVPLDGARERGKDSFTLIGEDDKIISYTWVSLKDGQIKGFTLIWPTGDEERRTRLLAEMKTSFTRLEGVLDPVAGGDAEQSVDLVSGLEIRRPKLSRSGFFIDGNGTVVTSTQAVNACTKITLDGEYEAKIVARDDNLGIAILQPADTLAPMSVASLLTGAPRLQSDIAVSGYSFEGVLNAPTLTFGTLADLRGLHGEPELKRLTMAALPGDAGGPVFDAGGAVLGMLLPTATSGQQLPENVSFAADASAIQSVLDQAGVSATTNATTSAMAPEDLTRLATGMTVLVSCW